VDALPKVNEMKLARFFGVASLIWMCAIAPAGAEPTGPRSVDFNRDIRTILSNKCFACHGPDEAERQAGLRLDRADGITAETDSGAVAVVPGDVEKSELIRRITSADESVRMPPGEFGKSLSPREIELLTQWVREGAPYAQHWSYVQPVRPEPPSVEQHPSWPRNEIDHFLLARLIQEGLAPSAEADRYTLIRRLSLDLTGLPPTIEEVDAFINDADPQAYEHLVDRLLERPSYGEHWARKWLDLARYADSAGYADDPPRTIWGFRDYVIRSLNANKSFDQFTIEQLAGDLLPSPTDEQLIATAFHRNTLTNNEGGTNDEEFRNVAVVDRVNTTFAVWMGTTMACAQCHSHKYDPISQEDYFRVFAILNNSADADQRDESPLLEVWTDEQTKQKEDWQAEIALLEAKLQTMTPELAAEQAEWEKQFSAELTWRKLVPESWRANSGATMQLAEDGTISVARQDKTDVYELEFAADQPTVVHALRLEALPDASLPGGGPGHAGGNFVVSRVLASVMPPDGASLQGRYVRVDLPGQDKLLSLAEVQVFSGSDNVALKAKAKQSSTDFGGAAKLAIDGNTDGDYSAAMSTTHTRLSKDPWWELDLQDVKAIDRIAVWNRTDNNLQSRLNGYRLSILDANHSVVWEETIAEAPKLSHEHALSGPRPVSFRAALADHQQTGFEASHILDNKDLANKGWAIAPQFGQPHELTLIPASPVEVPAGARIKLTIEQLSKHEYHTLGRFRVLATDDGRAFLYSQTPASVLAILKLPADQRTEPQQADLEKHFLSIASSLQAGRDRLASVKKLLAEAKPYTTVPIMRELAGDQRRTTKIQRRGNFLDTGDVMSEGVPAAFHPLAEGTSPNRLVLAQWLVSTDNPLTARVIANRYWEALFGIGIVSTSEEFGTQGELPSHPELLDWLATELVRLKWDMKAFVKLLVTTAAYRQSSGVTPELYERDPDNRLLARGPRFRLSAEMVRDQALFVAGLLSGKMYGPPVKPPQPSIGLTAAFGSGIDWQTSDGDDRYRRGLYTTWRRSNPYPSMAAFDAPNQEVCTIRRDRTNTPLQALVTLNDPVYVEAAQALARRMGAAGQATAERATFVFRLCLARPPREDELARLVGLYESARETFAQHPSEAEQMATNPLGPIPAGADAADLAAWTVVGNVILNLDEMFMKR